MKNRFLSLLLGSTLLLTLLALSGFASSPRVHAASHSATLPASACVSQTEWGDYTGGEITVCPVGNGNVQTTTQAFGGCMVTVSMFVRYSNATQDNSTGQPCTSFYSHRFPAVHETGNLYICSIISISELGASETHTPCVSLHN
jgi:hypothetical protein